MLTVIAIVKFPRKLCANYQVLSVPTVAREFFLKNAPKLSNVLKLYEIRAKYHFFSA